MFLFLITVVKISFFEFGLSICFRAGKVIETTKLFQGFGENKSQRKENPAFRKAKSASEACQARVDYEPSLNEDVRVSSRPNPLL